MERPLCRSVFAIILLVVSSAIRIGGGTAAADVTPEAGGGLQVLITTSELVVGQNRFAFGLLKANKLLEGADVTLRVYSIEGSEEQLAAELNAPYQAVGKIRQQRSGTSPCGWDSACPWWRIWYPGPLRGAAQFCSGRHLEHRDIVSKERLA